MQEELFHTYLSLHPLLAQVPADKKEMVIGMARFSRTDRGFAINYGQDGQTRIHFLLKGKVKLIEMMNGDMDCIKDILTEPDVFGDLSLSGKLENEEIAETLTSNTIICSFSVIQFRKIVEELPAVFFAYTKIVTQKLLRLENRHTELAHVDTRNRLINFFIKWAKSDGNQVGDKIILRNYLTHSDIAGFIATSRQNVNMLFNEFRNTGQLCYNRKHLELNNISEWKNARQS